MCAFGADENTILILCADGSYYKVAFDHVSGGEMRRVDYQRFDTSNTTDDAIDLEGWN